MSVFVSAGCVCECSDDDGVDGSGRDDYELGVYDENDDKSREIGSS